MIVKSKTTISCARPITPRTSQRRSPPLLTEVASDIRSPLLPLLSVPACLLPGRGCRPAARLAYGAGEPASLDLGDCAPSAGTAGPVARCARRAQRRRRGRGGSPRSGDDRSPSRRGGWVIV